MRLGGLETLINDEGSMNNLSLSLRETYQLRDLKLFEEKVRLLLRQGENSIFVEFFLELQENLQKEFQFEAIKYQTILAPAILKTGAEPHMAWYVLATVWEYWNSFEFLDYKETHPLQEGSFLSDLYTMAYYSISSLGDAEISLNLCQKVLQTIFPNKFLRAAFMVKDLFNRDSNHEVFRRTHQAYITEEEVKVIGSVDYWRENWNTRKWEKEKSLPPEILYEESEGKLLTLKRNIPWAPPQCLHCGEAGGIWEPGALEGKGVCPYCKVEYRNLYGTIVSKAFQEKEKLLKEAGLL